MRKGGGRSDLLYLIYNIKKPDFKSGFFWSSGCWLVFVKQDAKRSQIQFGFVYYLRHSPELV